MQIFIYAVLKYTSIVCKIYSLMMGRNFSKRQLRKLPSRKGQIVLEFLNVPFQGVAKFKFEIEKIPRKIEDHDDSDILLSFEKKYI